MISILKEYIKQVYEDKYGVANFSQSYNSDEYVLTLVDFESLTSFYHIRVPSSVLQQENVYAIIDSIGTIVNNYFANLSKPKRKSKLPEWF